MKACKERNLWNSMVLPHACHPEGSCLRKLQYHKEHLGNFLRCLYSINHLHISIAGSCVIISSHVLSWSGPFAEQKAGAVSHPHHCRAQALCIPQGVLDCTGWRYLTCRVQGWSAGGKPYGVKIWQVKPAAFEMQMDLRSSRCHRAWQTLHTLVCYHLALHCRDRNKPKAPRRCSLFK